MKMMKIFTAIIAALLLVSSPMVISSVYAYDPYEPPYETTKPEQKQPGAVKKTSKKAKATKKKTTTKHKNSKRKTPSPKPKAATKQKVPQAPYSLVNWDFRNMTVTLRNNSDGTQTTLYLELLGGGGIRLNDTVNDGTVFVVPRGYIAHCNPDKHESLDKPGTEALNDQGYPFIIFSSGTTVRCNDGEGPVATLFRSGNN